MQLKPLLLTIKINKVSNQSAVENDRTLISYACDEEREHPVFCLMSVQLKEKLRHYLASGERRLLQFMKENGGISVKFTKKEGNFENFNTLDDLKKNSNLIDN